MAAFVQLLHPSLGEIKGKPTDKCVAQFLGLQYATIKDRYAPPELVKYNENQTIDATSLGYDSPKSVDQSDY